MPLSSITEPTASDRGEALARIGPAHQATLAAVADALTRLRYGAVHLTVHDGKVVQLDVTERQRFT
jgi:hypothetical protein